MTADCELLNQKNKEFVQFNLPEKECPFLILEECDGLTCALFNLSMESINTIEDDAQDSQLALLEQKAATLNLRLLPWPSLIL